MASSTSLEIRAVPGSRRVAVVGRHGEAWKVRVRSAPEKGRANEELKRLLAEWLELPRSAVRLERGQSSRDKRFSIDGRSAEEVDAMLRAQSEAEAP